MRALLGRLSGFALFPALSMLASLVLLPLIAVHDGASGWSAMGLGQNVGALIGLVGGLAWAIVGAQRIVEAKTLDGRSKVFALSLASRGVVIAVLSVISAPLVWILAAHGQALAAVLFMFATALNGLTASWYYAGTGDPRRLVLNEGVTRTVGYVAAIGLVAWTGATVAYAACTLVSGIVSVCLNWKTIFRGKGFPHVTVAEVTEVFRTQASGTFSRMASGLHMYAPTALLSAFAPGSVPVYTAIDNVYKSGCNALSFLPSAMIQWMQPAGGMVARRKRVSLGICVGTGLGVGLVWPLVGRWIMGYLFQGRLVGAGIWIELIGITVGLALIVTSIGLLEMVPRGMEWLVYRVEMVASLIAVAAVVPMAKWLGGGGAFATYGLAAILKIGMYMVMSFPKGGKRFM